MVHRAQGSESDEVMFNPGPDSLVGTRELLYTAVARAPRSLSAMANEPTLETALESRTTRATGLSDRLASNAFSR